MVDNDSTARDVGLTNLDTIRLQGYISHVSLYLGEML